MSLPVVFLKSAEFDLKELKNYLAKSFGKASWQISYDKIQEAVNTLQAFPMTGKMPDELEKLNLTQYRQVLSGMSRIIYEVRQQTIYIHIICDCRKNIKSLLLKRLLRAD
jgi:toxin ParE1/3/4